MTTQTTTQTHHIVQTSSAKMPNSCWGRYGNVAVLEVDAGLDSVSMISERARGCHQIVSYEGRLNIGSTDRCAFARAHAAAEALADELNREADERAGLLERYSAGSMACLLAA